MRYARGVFYVDMAWIYDEHLECGPNQPLNPGFYIGNILEETPDRWSGPFQYEEEAKAEAKFQEQEAEAEEE